MFAFVYFQRLAYFKGAGMAMRVRFPLPAPIPCEAAWIKALKASDQLLTSNKSSQN
jgi:hypothetical protein